MDQYRIGRFDQVRLLSTKNVSYLSNNSGMPASPKGTWSVAAIVDDNQLLLVKRNVVIRVPASDVLKIAEYNISELLSKLGKLSHGQRKNEERRNEEHRN